MRHLQRALVALTVTVLLLSAAAAEESKEPLVLPPVIVEAPREVPVITTPDRLLTAEEARREIERTPGGIGLVGQEDIEDSLGANLRDVLEFVPGVLVRPRRGGTSDESQISIRGSGLRNNFHVRGLNVLIDGFSVNNADGFFRPEVLEPLAAKRVEVYKGANALRFGANSLGGAINVVTKTGADAPLVEARSEGGSYGFFKNYLATGQLHGPFDAYAGLSQSELDGFQDHSNHSRQRAYATAGYRFEGGPSLRLDFNFVNNREQLPGALTRAEFDRDPRQAQPAAITQNARHDFQFTRAAFQVHTPLTKTQVIEWFGQYHYTDLDHPLPFAVIDNVDNNWGTELRYILAAPLFGHGNRLTAGLQYAETRQADVNFANLQGTRGAKTKDQINRARNIGLYAEDHFDLTPAVTLVAGGRLQYAFRSVDDRFLTEADAQPDDSGSIDYVSFSPRVGAIWQVSPAVQIYGNASRAYEPPLILELTAPGQLTGDLGALNPQKSWQFEIGTRGSMRDRLAWDISVYDIELWDEIQNLNVQPFPGAPFTIPRFQNIDRSRHLGVEAGVDVRVLDGVARTLGMGDIGDTLTLRTAYTWSRFVFINDPTFGNNNIPGAPEHFIAGELRYDHPSRFWLAPRIESVPKGYFVNSENTVRTDPYVLVSLRMGYEYVPWNLRLFFEARNLTDTNYVSAVVVDAADGRFFQPGDGRGFYGGIEVKW